jgi:aminoglycoside 2''-phosphotransferase
MFEGLNAIPWGELTHAYGSAEEVPVWLRQLTSADAKVRQKAMYELVGSICHQGTIWPATGYAVPFLIELLQAPAVQDKDSILGLLAAIATGDQLDEAIWRENPDEPELTTVAVPAHIPIKDARAETAAGIPVCISLLGHEQESVRMQAGQALAAFPEQASELRRILLDTIEREPSWLSRARLILSMSALSNPIQEHLRYFNDAVRSGKSELERFTAALALARLAKAATRPLAVTILASTLLQPTVTLAAAYAELAGGAKPEGAARAALYALGPGRLRFLVPALTEKIGTGGEFADWFNTELLLFILFDGKPGTNQAPRPAEDLTEEQRIALLAVNEAISDLGELWRIGNFTNLLKSYGLPNTRDGLAAYLGRARPQPDPIEPARAHNAERPRHEPLDTYRERIRESYPDLRLTVIAGKWKNQGQNNDVITINEGIIFRFPRHARAVEKMEREIALLRGLQGRLPLPIPDPTYSSQGTRKVGRAFMGYEKLPGKPLYREMLESVDGEETVQRLATQLAEFLRALHGVPPNAFAIPLPVTNSRATWVLMYERTRKKLFWHMRPDAREQVSAHFERFLDDPRNFEWTPVLIHGDFGPGNILYDAKRRVISGIIDFSSAGLGDPATDLAALITPLSYGEDFLPRFVPAYPGIADLVERARFYMGTFALQEALFGVEHDDREAFERGIADYA